MFSGLKDNFVSHNSFVISTNYELDIILNTFYMIAKER